MKSHVRRIVTGHDDNGKAIVIMDSPAPNRRVRDVGKIVSTLLWATDESPADMAGDADRADRPASVAPPARGSVLRIVEFPPADVGGPVDNEAMLKEMGIAHGGAPVRHPSMHRTKSVDYAICLEGEIDMLLDDSEVHLKAGDVLIQQGTNHAWVNRGTEVCRIAFVLIDGQEP
jgi:mannose-6-phosphate isomerase-like protein (cupin superfamily)